MDELEIIWSFCCEDVIKVWGDDVCYLSFLILILFLFFNIVNLFIVFFFFVIV